MIADRGQGQHQGRQALLAVHQQPPVNPSSPQSRARGDDHRSHEMRARRSPVRHRLTLREQIPPQLRQLLAAPAVGPLIQRNLELLLALDKIEKTHLMRAHASSTPD